MSKLAEHIAADVAHAPPPTVAEGYAAVPVFTGESPDPLQLCVLVRAEAADGAGDAFATLRHTSEARVLLGCVLDRGGTVHRWVEIVVQTLDRLQTKPSSFGEEFSNRLLDDRWARFAEALVAMDRDGLIRTGYEAVHPLPTFIDRAGMKAVHLVDRESGQRWQLCQDDELLRRAGLPPYTSSLHRYLYLPAGQEAEHVAFIPASPDAPISDWTRPLEKAVEEASRLLPFNPWGGLMLIRQHDPTSLSAFIDAVKAGTLPPPAVGFQLSVDGSSAGPAPTGNGQVTEMKLSDGGRLFMGRASRGSRLLESLHLKLRALADAACTVRELTLLTQCPMLNLSEESFRVRLGQPGRGLPLLWTARTVLASPGAAVTVQIPSTELRYYLRPSPGQQSIYEPAGAARAISGVGRVRIRQVTDDRAGGALVEGTFAAHERIEPVESDLLWLRLTTAGRPIELHAHFDSQSALAGGEWRFRTVAQRHDPQTLQLLRDLEGRELPQVQFQIMPLLSSPCDLYALGVLAVRVLLVDDGTTLAKSLDEVHSLGREVAAAGDSDASPAPLAERIASVFSRDGRWLEAIGPHRLAAESIDPAASLQLVPGGIWCGVLAMILRMFPGLTPESACRDYGDARSGALHRVYDTAVDDLDSLVLRTRSLIAVDWSSNREIHRVLREYAPEPGR